MSDFIHAAATLTVTPLRSATSIEVGNDYSVHRYVPLLDHIRMDMRRATETTAGWLAAEIREYYAGPDGEPMSPPPAAIERATCNLESLPPPTPVVLTFSGLD